jgi:hypothetical protein
MKHLLTIIVLACALQSCAQPAQDSARLEVWHHPPTKEGAQPNPRDFVGYSIHVTRVYSKLGFAKGSRLARFRVDRFVEAIPEKGWFVVDVSYDGKKQARLLYRKPEYDRAHIVEKREFLR